MQTLQRDRLKSSRTDSGVENTEHTTSESHVVGTLDGEINVDLPATPGYDREYDSLIEEAIRR
ncbi:hypothetical protein C481_20936 [Natrialba asiatica DSM 12278]|uniref:Uncharacterized protein n=1 Tax=Natrialba asiatica (strain ATCC 700177 / DSM 12278 / JCM 9576 / FERM P-10747 / NBRC 102637 / 172P1) TaxID=29540 RepID=M0AFC0_NATA1|nr:hypothetical protein C481_20936 [Natrialba asiatica DSM 12278]